MYNRSGRSSNVWKKTERLPQGGCRVVWLLCSAGSGLVRFGDYVGLKLGLVIALRKDTRDWSNMRHARGMRKEYDPSRKS